MNVEFQNFGDLNTTYVVSVTECTQNIDLAIPQQSRTLEPMDKANLKFEINTTYNLDTTSQCLVSLKSTTGRLYDSVWVLFDTEKHSEHETSYSWELQQKNLAGQGEVCPECLDTDGDGVFDMNSRTLNWPDR